MIRTLFEAAADDSADPRLHRRVGGDLLEELRRHQPGTGEVHQQSAGIEQPEPEPGDVLIGAAPLRQHPL